MKRSETTHAAWAEEQVTIRMVAVARKLRDMAFEIDRLTHEDSRRGERLVHLLAWGLANCGADDVIVAERELADARLAEAHGA